MSRSSRSAQPTQPWAQSSAEPRPKVDFEKLNDEMKFYPSQNFVLTAASVTISEEHVLIVHNTNPKYDETFYTLPGGRKNVDETLHQTAVRETLEETGYSIRLPVGSHQTRATLSQPRGAGEAPTTGFVDSSRQELVNGLTCHTSEPIGMITYQDPLANGCTRLRFFFYALLLGSKREAPACGVPSLFISNCPFPLS